MMRAALGRAASVAQLAAAVLIATLAIRFSVTAVLRGVGERTPRLAPSGTEPSGSASASLPMVTTTTTAVAPSGPTAAAGASLRVPLIVGGGGPRSEVFVGGVKVGHTPYLGEVSCKAGEVVRIQVLPPTGSPTHYTRRCAPGTLRVED